MDDGVHGGLGRQLRTVRAAAPSGVPSRPVLGFVARQPIYDGHGQVFAYELLFRSISGERVEPLRRYYGEGFVVDETLWHGTIEDGAPFLCDGKRGKVSFRLLHVFELRSKLEPNPGQPVHIITVRKAGYRFEP